MGYRHHYYVFRLQQSNWQNGVHIPTFKRLESSHYDSWDSEQQNPSLRSTVSCNDKGLLTEYFVMVWDLDSWKNYNRFSYTYNEAMDMLTNTYETWKETMSVSQLKIQRLWLWADWTGFYC